MIAVSEAARDAVRDFLVAWALGLWALGYDDRVVYWRSYDDSAAIADPADAVATAFATTFLGARDGDAMRTGTAVGLARLANDALARWRGVGARRRRDREIIIGPLLTVFGGHDVWRGFTTWRKERG